MISVPSLQALVGETAIYEAARSLSENGVPNDFQVITTAPFTISGTDPSGAAISGLVGGTAILRGASLTVGLQIPLGTQYGGTGTTTTFTQGSVIFAGASGVYSQDNANLFYNSTSKYFGVGTASPSLDIQIKKTTAGAIGLAVTNLSANAAALAKVEVQSDDALHGGRMSVTSSGATPARLVRVEAWGTGSDLRLGTVSGDAITVLSSNNFVGIGTNAPLTVGHLKGANAVSFGGGFPALLALETSTTSGLDVGPAISMGGQTGNGVTPYVFGRIIAAKGSTTAGDYTSYLAFRTSNAVGGEPEIMRLTGGGNVGIGTTAPAATLDIGVGSYATRPQNITVANGANNDFNLPVGEFFVIVGPTAAANITGFAGGVNGRRVTITNSTGQNVTLNHNNAGSAAANRMLINAGVDIVIGSYNSVILQYNQTIWYCVGKA